VQESIEWQSPLGDRSILCVYYKYERVCACVLLTEEEHRLIEVGESR